MVSFWNWRDTIWINIWTTAAKSEDYTSLAEQILVKKANLSLQITQA